MNEWNSYVVWINTWMLLTMIPLIILHFFQLRDRALHFPFILSYTCFIMNYGIIFLEFLKWKVTESFMRAKHIWMSSKAKFSWKVSFPQFTNDVESSSGIDWTHFKARCQHRTSFGTGIICFRAKKLWTISELVPFIDFYFKIYFEKF